MMAQNATYLRMMRQDDLGSPASFPDVTHLDTRTKWMAHLQAALWNRQTFHDMIVPGHNPWESESSLNARARQKGTGFYSLNTTAPDILPYVEGVKGGFWLKRAVEYCQENHLQIDLKTRPCPPWGNEWHRKFYRSLLKRRMEWSRMTNAVRWCFPSRQKVSPAPPYAPVVR
jgi:hypothetical protein